jgi:hypothetical protein
MANLGAAWLVVWVLPGFGIIPVLPEVMQFWFLMALGAVIFIPVTMLTRPEPMDHLVKYYVMTRPLGWWGPVHREAVRQGLIREGAKAPSPSNRRRPLIRRSWTAEEATEWTREDWIAIVLSPIIYALVMIGVALLFLGQLSGIWMTVMAVLLSFLLYWVIDPKLKAISNEYEEKQAAYLDDLERGLRWEEGATQSNTAYDGTGQEA